METATERENCNNYDTQHFGCAEPSSPAINIPRSSENPADESAERIYSLQNEVSYVNNKLQSMMYNLALKEKENQILKMTLQQLEENANNRDSATNLEGCTCSNKCLLF